MKKKYYQTACLDTPLGQMTAVADETDLYLLEFTDRLRKKITSIMIPGYTQPIRSIEGELRQYFEGALVEFRTPLFFLGSPFQRCVWEELKKIPFGKTRSYLEVAIAIGKPTAYRAVAQANGANPFAIIIPCHRVINTNGKLGGYGGGLSRKEWLLNHEKSW